MNGPSTRAQIVERRTYLRPINDDGTIFETFEQSVDRMIGHQQWLWERAKGGMSHDDNDEWVLEPLDATELAELEELRVLLLERKVTLAGRTRWLGGTAVSRMRESSMFNCAFKEIRSVYDVVDALWLLLQGCGVGFRPIVGNLNGFHAPINEIDVIRSVRTGKGGRETNKESFNRKTGVWTITIGDSAEAWAKSIGKLIAGKFPAKKLVLDLSQIRPAGERLKGYGWISSGDAQIAIAYPAIARILSGAAGRLLTRIEILDIVNWLGTVLSSRRSAEICLMEVGEEEWEEFAVAKKDHFSNGQPQRAQSNNTLVFPYRPHRTELENIFDLMMDAGGSEPGFSNGQEAKRRAPWYKGGNPCYEILLGDGSFCNLVETVLFRFNGDTEALWRAHELVARANYRQTCVWLDDGILQRSWHELNEYLHLCGVGVTGVVSWDVHGEAHAWRDLRDAAHRGANGMADELGMPRAKAVTTIKPSGTQSKTLSLVGQECPEGIHKPLGRFIFNNIGMSKYDPLVPLLADAGYYIFDNPYDATGVLVRVPVEYSNIEFDTIERDGTVLEVNLETAVSQLDRYKLVMENYVDHNCSITVSYDPDEVPAIIDWFEDNWDTYVGVSFLFRNDPTKTAEDLGYPYLPQEVVDEATFRTYADTLRQIQWESAVDSELEIDAGADCATGACPVR